MGNVIKVKFRRHAQRSGARTKAPSGTSPLEISLKRWAKPRLTSLRPAKMLRICESEQPAAAAKSLTVTPLDRAHDCRGCSEWSDMTGNISERNGKVNGVIFPVEIYCPNLRKIQCGMGKKPKFEPREIYLGEWLHLKGKTVGEAAEKAGCTQSYISNISRGARPNVNALYLLRLSEWLEINVNDLFQPPPPAAHVESFAKLSDKATRAVLQRKAR